MTHRDSLTSHNVRRLLLTTDAIAGDLGARYLRRLWRQILVDTSTLPTVVLTGHGPHGTKIRVVDIPALSLDDDGPVRRGFLWVAMVGDFELHPTKIRDGVVEPGRVVGGTEAAVSVTSAEDALALARHNLAG